MNRINGEKIFVLLLPLFLLACEKQDEEPEVVAHTDAYVIRKVIGGQEKMATAYYAFANTGLSSVTVTPSTGVGNPFELDADSLSFQSFYKDPEAEDYNTIWPDEADYLFEVTTKEGLVIQQTDNLERVELEIPAIVSTVYFPLGNALKVQWSKNSGADGIILKLLDPDRDVLFISHLLLPSTAESFITESTGSWLSIVYPGDKLILQVQSVAYESGVSEENSIYNIATVAITEKIIIWGS